MNTLTPDFYEHKLKSQLSRRASRIRLDWPGNLAVQVAWLKAIVDLTYQTRFGQESRENFITLCKTNQPLSNTYPLIAWDEGKFWNVDPNGPLGDSAEDPVPCEGRILLTEDALFLETHNERLISFVSSHAISTCTEMPVNEKIYHIPKHLLLSVMGIFLTLGKVQMDGASSNEIIKAVLAKADIGPITANILWGRVEVLPEWSTGKVTVRCTNNIFRMVENFLDTLTLGTKETSFVPNFTERTSHF